MKRAIREDRKVRTTVLLDPRLVHEAKEACGAATNTEAIESGLRELVRKAALKRLADLITQPDPTFRAARRRRPG